MAHSGFRHDFSKLHKFVQGLGDKRVVKIGILGDNVERKAKEADSDVTNAEIGLVHEFGSFTRGIPERSILRMPLHNKQDQVVKGASKGAEKLLAEGNKEQVLRNLGASALAVVDKAFDTRGYGNWPPDSPATVHAKGSSQVLVDRGELRRSISFEVADKQ